MNLNILGWNDFFAGGFAPHAGRGLLPGRVASVSRHLYRVYTEQDELLAEVSERMRHESSRRDLPAVGDWVAVSPRGEEKRATICAVLPRKSQFSRRAAGTGDVEQVLAANIDILFIVSGLDHDHNPRRIERYLTLAGESGASPVIVLNKSDLCSDLEQKVREVRAVAGAVPVHVISCTASQGLEQLTAYLGVGVTAALLGSSGVGKSTLVNRILGEEAQRVREVRAGDSRGRHTTTSRELKVIPSGGMLIDNPGMRELRLGTAEEGLGSAFADIDSLAAGCRFSDCRHREEPGCAVRLALEEGALERGRFESYLKLQREIAYQVRKENLEEYRLEKERWKKIRCAFRKGRRQ